MSGRTQEKMSVPGITKRQKHLENIHTLARWILHFTVLKQAATQTVWWSPPILCVSLCFMNRLWQAVCGMSLWWICSFVPTKLPLTASIKGLKTLYNSVTFGVLRHYRLIVGTLVSVLMFDQKGFKSEAKTIKEVLF